jgi:hypothetical protein
VLLPARRRPLRAAGHPDASRLRRIAGTEIRIVPPAWKPNAWEPEPRPRSRRHGVGAG